MLTFLSISSLEGGGCEERGERGRAQPGPALLLDDLLLLITNNDKY